MKNQLILFCGNSCRVLVGRPLRSGTSNGMDNAWCGQKQAAWKSHFISSSAPVIEPRRIRPADESALLRLVAAHDSSRRAAFDASNT